ncbi:MAG: glycosyltransferase [Chloroflexi bacterium]|nr:glycosyltransferase [Chloroflexota bacterium]
MTDRVSTPPGPTARQSRRAVRRAGRAGLGPTISVVVPVFNEQATLERLLATLLASDLADEVICVDDASTDSSSDILRRFGQRIALLELPDNCGKGGALAAGIRRAHGDIVVFVDADLTNLTEDHLKALVTPLRDGLARAALGFFPGDSGYSRFVARLTGPRFTGERAYFRRDLLASASRSTSTGCSTSARRWSCHSRG